MKKVKPIAIYLPQFHPIPENDKWWGKGFTEWANVVKAKPLFKGHHQPHLPADLGFYDLRLNEIREAQAQLAHDNGIFGFCYYHYWFNGKRLLNLPFDEVLKSGKPDFPFMLCWANENWTRVWNGQNKDILIEQKYSSEDDKAHMEFLCEHVFPDKRYIKINDKPVFALYKSFLLPSAGITVKTWRETAVKFGFKDLYLLKFITGKEDPNPILQGFDAAVEFQPDWSNLPPRIKAGLPARILHKLGISESPYLKNSVFNYLDLVNRAMSYDISDYKYYRCVTPSWDNSARKEKKAHIFINSTPEVYGEWLKNTVRSFKPFSAEENFIFINAWNEWAEGNHLEPCQKWGMKYLEETKRILDEYSE